MDPQETLRRWLEARKRGDRAEAREYKGYLMEWLRRGGFEPRWSPDVRAAFFGQRRQRRNPRRARRRNGGGAGSMLLGVGVLAGLVYLVARSSSSGVPRLAGVYDRIPG